MCLFRSHSTAPRDSDSSNKHVFIFIFIPFIFCILELCCNVPCRLNMSFVYVSYLIMAFPTPCDLNTCSHLQNIERIRTRTRNSTWSEKSFFSHFQMIFLCGFHTSYISIFRRLYSVFQFFNADIFHSDEYRNYSPIFNFLSVQTFAEWMKENMKIISIWKTFFFYPSMASCMSKSRFFFKYFFIITTSFHVCIIDSSRHFIRFMFKGMKENRFKSFISRFIVKIYQILFRIVVEMMNFPFSPHAHMWGCDILSTASKQHMCKWFFHAWQKSEKEEIPYLVTTWDLTLIS